MTEIAPIKPSLPTYNLPSRQKDALDFIVGHINKHEQSPTLPEIAAGLEIKKASAQSLVNALVARGYITKTKQHRSIVVL